MAVEILRGPDQIANRMVMTWVGSPPIRISIQTNLPSIQLSAGALLRLLRAVLTRPRPAGVKPCWHPLGQGHSRDRALGNIGSVKHNAI